MYRLHRTTHIPAELDRVFAFFKDPANLEAITPPWLSFRIVSSTDVAVREGTRIAYRLRLYRVPIHWLTRITEYSEGASFADEQLRGPYTRWYHRHRFRVVPHGVEMTDEVEYTLPFGPLGRLVHWVAVRRQLATIFDYRARAIAARFASTQ